MSAFLGRIHYWLYNKIEFYETLIEESVKQAEGDHSDLLAESYSLYGDAAKGELENIIDHNNIHGWLQNKIHSVENRFAFVISKLLASDSISKEQLITLFKEIGQSKAREIGQEFTSPEEIYNVLNNLLLDGMPCDRVNEVIENDASHITWATRLDLHKDYWAQTDHDVALYHDLKTALIEGLLENSSFVYKNSNNTEHTIERV